MGFSPSFWKHPFGYSNCFCLKIRVLYHTVYDYPSGGLVRQILGLFFREIPVANKGVHSLYPPVKLTWQRKKSPFYVYICRTYIFKWSIFHCYVDDVLTPEILDLANIERGDVDAVLHLLRDMQEKMHKLKDGVSQDIQKRLAERPLSSGQIY